MLLGLTRNSLGGFTPSFYLPSCHILLMGKQCNFVLASEGLDKVTQCLPLWASHKVIFPLFIWMSLSLGGSQSPYTFNPLLIK